MSFSKARRWLLLSATLLSLPVVLASWWMLSSGKPVARDREAEGHGERLHSGIGAGDAATDAAAERQLRMTDAQGTTEAKSDTDDFRAYAAGLKAQSFPETTVRELLASRITAAFQARRTAIRSTSRQGGADAAEIQRQLDTLNREQGALIAQLVGAEEQPVADATAAAAVEATASGNERQVLMPAVMANALPATVRTEEQAAAWEKLRNDFVNAIGGENQDPASPQYRRRWVQAESESDQRFRLIYGDTVFVQHQMQAQREAALRAQGLIKQ